MNDNRHFRASPRPRATIPVAIWRGGDSESPRKKIDAYTNNISMGGLFAATDEPLVVGERVEVDIQAPSTWAPVRYKAEVLRVQGDGEGEAQGVGLRFLEITEAQAVALAEFAASLDFDS